MCAAGRRSGQDRAGVDERKRPTLIEWRRSTGTIETVSARHRIVVRCPSSPAGYRRPVTAPTETNDGERWRLLCTGPYLELVISQPRRSITSTENSLRGRIL